MKLLFATIYASLCFALVTAIHLGPLNSATTIGLVGPTSENHTDKEIRAANNVIGILEYVRRLMPVGINDLLKVTEPYSKDVLAPVILLEQNGPVVGKVDLTNLVASGAQQFTLHDVEVVLDSKRLEFNISVPVVVVDVDFEGIDLILGNILKFNTSGTSHIVLTDLNVDGAFSVKCDNDEDPSSPYVLTGLEVTNSVADVEVDVFGEIPDTILVEIKDALMKSVAETAMDEITEVLSHFTVEQVNHFLEI